MTAHGLCGPQNACWSSLTSGFLCKQEVTWHSEVHRGYGWLCTASADLRKFPNVTGAQLWSCMEAADGTKPTDLNIYGFWYPQAIWEQNVVEHSSVEVHLSIVVRHNCQVVEFPQWKGLPNLYFVSIPEHGSKACVAFAPVMHGL